MNNFTLAALLSAIPDLRDVLQVMALLVPQCLKLLGAIRSFRRQAPTPEKTYAFETELAAIVREVARVVVEHEYNHIEPECRDDCSMRLRFAGEEYRRRPKSPKRLGTLFGAIELRRYLYEAVEPGEPALFPLEKQLGIEAGLTTPALAERVGCGR